MDFLQQNKNVVIIVAVVVIGYLLLQTELIQGLLLSLRIQWAGLSDLMKVVVLLLVVYCAYYCLTNKQSIL
ncbi:hypothetical protein Klosneuvirus_9_17 [Klosneuvirus KNV1]|uniref:Uncharacterized protein n=1 Tax=Klosneuvirus KNV1 TaxID=1977640 RepID=A0A1V0SLK2_9VIRU|nr:hypothetical protein Klosneuvirus_9_17 [Klosneuvirus KNV1]